MRALFDSSIQRLYLAHGRCQVLFESLINHICGVLKGCKEFRQVIAPKALASANLARATSGFPVKNWTHFSSLSAFLGTPGQANYAIANAQLNTWARLQRQQGGFVMIL